MLASCGISARTAAPSLRSWSSRLSSCFRYSAILFLQNGLMRSRPRVGLSGHAASSRAGKLEGSPLVGMSTTASSPLELIGFSRATWPGFTSTCGAALMHSIIRRRLLSQAAPHPLPGYSRFHVIAFSLCSCPIQPIHSAQSSLQKHSQIIEGDRTSQLTRRSAHASTSKQSATRPSNGAATDGGPLALSLVLTYVLPWGALLDPTRVLDDRRGEGREELRYLEQQWCG